MKTIIKECEGCSYKGWAAFCMDCKRYLEFRINELNKQLIQTNDRYTTEKIHKHKVW